ncbi:MAG TPA: S41 family peptidase, partial [Phycisphaerae bacterium]|nr:S41 family peptidase [Phycisphaerae bacterium]
VHLRAMGGDNFTEWAKGYYPVFTRKGLIIDVRHNRGGNIDSWILSRLLRKVWFYWNQHAGRSPTWNMQQAFRGHMVVLCNERTASDGEAFSEGFKRLGLGKIIGTRTWGGEIWLSSSNFLVDGGIATSAEYGVFGPEGEWLIEGHGVEPDIVVDNLPHATFKGGDEQLKAAIRHLQQRIAEEPVELPPVPPTPNKSFRYPARQP